MRAGKAKGINRTVEAEMRIRISRTKIEMSWKTMVSSFLDSLYASGPLKFDSPHSFALFAPCGRLVVLEEEGENKERVVSIGDARQWMTAVDPPSKVVVDTALEFKGLRDKSVKEMLRSAGRGKDGTTRGATFR